MPSRQRRPAPVRPLAGGIDDLTSGLEPCLADVGGLEQVLPAACSGGASDLSALDESQRLFVLAALTARFSAGYLRWMRSRAGEVLSYSNVRVLEILESQGPTIMRDIAVSLGMTARNMTAIIDALEESGLVRRMPHPNDRRATVVELTSAGRKRAVQARCEAVGWVANAFNSLTVDEQRQYAELLGRLAEFFYR